jgi:hypothetical protein
VSTDQFIASLVHSLAWPGAVVGIAIVFRRQVVDLLSGAKARRLKAGPVEIEFDRVISSVEAELGSEPAPRSTRMPRLTLLEDLAPIARAAPTAAVLEAHSRLEHQLRELTQALGEQRQAGAVALARLALANDLITPETENAIVGVTTLRNLAAHGRQAELSEERAMDYLALVDAVLFAVGQRRRED